MVSNYYFIVYFNKNNCYFIKILLILLYTKCFISLNSYHMVV